MPAALVATNSRLRSSSPIAFEVIRIHTAKNCRSVIGRLQYDAYNRKFGLRVPIGPTTSTMMRGIGGCGTIFGEDRIQIAFVQLDVITDVTFSILAENESFLITNKYMLDTGLDISLQEHFLPLRCKHQPF